MAILVDWAKQTVSGTPGTGTITLSTAVSGFIRLQDDTRLVNGGLVNYTIEDGSNYERGIGTYTSSGTTLARTLIQAKLESGTYSENPGTGLTLTSAAIVSCSAVAATHNFRGALVTTSAAQSISSASYTVLNWGAEIFDSDGFHSNTVNNPRLTIPNASISKVRLIGLCYWDANATSWRALRIRKNGADFAGSMSVQCFPSVSQAFSMQIVSPTYSVNSGDYFTLEAYQATGTTLSVGGSTAYSSLTWFGIEVVE